jgi:HEAT repeat protein
MAGCLLQSFTAPALPGPTRVPALGGPDAARLSPAGAGAFNSAAEPTLYVFESLRSAVSRDFRKQVLGSVEFINFTTNLLVVPMEVDANREAAEKFAVAGVPTLVLATEEGKIIARHAGAMSVAELKDWVEAGRKRVRGGVWEGTAPTPELAKLSADAETRELATNELRQLVVFLGNPDPAVRGNATRALASQREAAMPALIAAAGDAYLGTRIAAGDLIENLAPGAPVPNPWASRDETQSGVAALKEWWTRTGKLPPAGAPQPLSAEGQAAVQAALAALLENNPARRTDAMSRLVAHGPAALPALRQVIHQREQAGDQRSLALLEDVRWAILIPDELERRQPGLRRTLARGISAERQEAARALARGGPPALPALVELASDADPLVVETTLGSLSTTGGADALTAMAALLKSPDANLRLTAAQSLGRSKDPAAVTPLLQALHDGDELVVVTALGGLEQVLDRESSSSKKSLPPELAAGLQTALGDSRWRVRAAAAEAAGKLKVHDTEESLKQLLNDTDGFVVKNALEALAKVGAKPEPEELLALARRMPALRGEVIGVIMSFRSQPAAKAVEELYGQASATERADLLRQLEYQSGESQGDSSVWEPLVGKTATDADPQVRRAGAATLPALPQKVSARVVEPFLRDEDPEVATLAAGTVIGLVSGKNVAGFDREEAPGHSYFHYSFSEEFADGTKKEKAYTTNQVAAWHALLAGRAEGPTNAVVASALFLTGQGTNDLPLVLQSLTHADEKMRRRLSRLGAVGLVLPRLPGSAGVAFVDDLARWPALYAQAMTAVDRVEPAVAARLAAPEPFLLAFNRALEAEQKEAILTLSYGKSWAHLQRAVPAFTTTLAASTNSMLRTLAVNALGDFGTNHLDLILAAAKDTNVWVRLAALRSFARISKPAELQARLAPMLGDVELRVARFAALGLLEPEVRNALGASSWLNDFEFEGIGGVTRSFSYTTESERPLARSETKPDWLPEARRQYAREPGEDNAVFAVLLAQHGEFDTLDLLIAAWRKAESRDRLGYTAALTTGIALSRDTKYVGVLREMLEGGGNSWEWRGILQGLRGMTGPEARQLRLEVNRRMRESGQ